jgi:DNA (cytosine-5)-methyltransferase 1
MDNQPGVNDGLRELALFAGAGGGILGGKLLGWQTVCAVERDPYAASVLVARQNDGLLPPFPIWDDVCTFDGRPWRGIVDVVSGGFPCQDISSAGKGAGIEGERSGLWSEMARIIGEVRPRFAFVENSPLLVGRGLARVLSDLATLGYDARWGVIGAANVGAPHKRDRIWIVANTNRLRESQPQGIEQDERRWACNGGDEVAHADSARLEKRQSEPGDNGSQFAAIERTDWWQSEPDVGRVAHGVAARVDRLRAIGNGQVPQCAAYAWRVLTDANADYSYRR